MRPFILILTLLAVPVALHAEETITLNHHIEGDGILTIKDLNLRLKIPKGWYNMEDNDWHNIAILISRKNTYTFKDGMITVGFGPLLEETLDDVLRRMVNELSARYKQETAIRIGHRQPAKIAGIEGFSETYLYKVKEDATSTFTFTMFKKNQFGYLIILCQPVENDGIFLRAYWEVVDSFEFIDPDKDIPADIAEKFINAQKKLFLQPFKEPKTAI